MAIRERLGFIASKHSKLKDGIKLYFGDGSDSEDGDLGDFSFAFDGTDFDVLQATANSSIKWGVSGAGIDQVHYGDTVGADMTWDQSADSLIFGDNAKVVFGTGSDISIAWDATDLDILQAGTNSAINIGVDGAGLDLKLFGDTASAYLLWDQSADALLLGGVARIDFNSATVLAGNTDGGLIRAGTSGARIVEDTADMRFININVDNGATSGDNRAIYNRLYLTGAGGGGESLRSFTTIEDVAGATAHGAHISLNFGATGTLTGLGVASRNTLHIPNGSLAGGTYAATQPEIYSDGASSAFSGTELSFIRVTNAGDATGVAAIDDTAFLLALSGGTIGAGNLMAVKTAAAISHTLRMKGPDGTTYYLMVSDAQ